PVRTADVLRHAELRGRFLLERLHVRAEDEAPRLDHGVDRLAEAREEWRVLRLDVDQRDSAHRAGASVARSLRIPRQRAESSAACRRRRTRRMTSQAMPATTARTMR